jgi:hypothetical protein
MKGKIFVLVFLALFSVTVLGGGSEKQEFFEDFSVDKGLWQEYDPINKIELDYTYDHCLEFNHWIRYEPGYVYRPFSTKDFILEYDIDITDDGGNANLIGPGFSDTLGTKKTIQNGAFAVYYAGFGGPQIDIQTFVNGSVEWDCGGWGNLPNRIWINTNTTYYVRFEKSENILKLSIFSDAERTQHISGSPKAVNTNLSAVTFNYFYAVNGPHANPQDNWEWTTGWIDNIYVRKEQGQNQPPVVDAGLDQTVEQETYEGTEVTQTGHISDADGDTLTYEWKEGDTVLASGTIPAPNEPPTDTDVTLTHIFPPGEHTVTLTVNDGEISSSDDALIIVEDTIPPAISVSVSPDVLWPPNHKMVDIQAAVTVGDIGDPAPAWTLVSITSNEPEEGPGKKHSPDIIGHEPGTPDLEFQLRAERLEQGEGRIYTITYQAVDSSGNSVSTEVIVIVPHDMGKGKK